MPGMNDTDKKISDLHNKARELLIQNEPEDNIIGELTKEGIDEGYASLIIENVKSDISDRKNFWREISTGIIITIMGIVLNILSYQAFFNARSSIFILFWGIVILGLSIVIRAFLLFWKS